MSKRMTIGRVVVRTEDFFAVAAALAIVAGLSAWSLPLGVGMGAALVIAVVLLAYRTLRTHAEHHYQQLEAVAFLVGVLAPRAPLPPFRGWAVSPDFARLVVEEILRARPRRVLECGSGVSTLVLAYALERAGEGHLIALEHDERYAERVRAWLSLHGLERIAEVRHAPLAPVELGGRVYDWYAPSALPAPPIDLAVVDGPPAPPASRYPTAALLGDRLAPGSAVILDDAGRREARDNLARWQAEHRGLAIEILDTEKGAAVVRGLAPGAPRGGGP